VRKPCDDYVMDIKLVGGKGYSNPITDDESYILINLFLTTASEGQTFDSFIIPFETLVELWPMEYVNTIESVVIRKVK